MVYRTDYTVNTELYLLTARYAYQTDDISRPVGIWKYESNMSHSGGAYYIMLVPLRDADFPNLLFGELYPWKGHRGTGIDRPTFALPATCKV